MVRLTTLALLVLVGCGGPQNAPPPEMTPLGQARALEIIGETVSARQFGAAQGNLSARFSNGTLVNVDTYVESLQAGFVWFNEQDRHNLNGAVPQPAEASELPALMANLVPDNRQVLVMVLQDQDYAYLPNPRADERAPEDRTIDDVEARLRRDARDFLSAVVDLRGGGEGD